MSDPFFQKKRKRSGETGAGKGRAPPRRGDDADSDDAGLEAVEDMDLRHTFDEDEAQESETPAEAKVRLAKLYLEGLHEKEEIDGIDAAARVSAELPGVRSLIVTTFGRPGVSFVPAPILARLKEKFAGKAGSK